MRGYSKERRVTVGAKNEREREGKGGDSSERGLKQIENEAKVKRDDSWGLSKRSTRCEGVGRSSLVGVVTRGRVRVGRRKGSRREHGRVDGC